MKIIFLALSSILITSCASNLPKDTHDNICHIYEYDDDWEDAAQESAKNWGTPDYVLMAMMHQESRFKYDARPKREYALGFIPLPRRSSAFGYPQAKDEVWKEYRQEESSYASRTDIEDSLDFMGWYNYRSYKRNRINRNNAYKLYLAYHEGHGGYQKKSYLKKKWLIKVAQKVQRRANLYKKQLKNCSRFKSYQQTNKKVPHKKNESKGKGKCNASWPYC